MAIEIGSPEARAVIVADKKLAQEAELAEALSDRVKAVRSSGLKVYRVRTPATVVQTVAAKDMAEAIEVALFSDDWEYDRANPPVATAAGVVASPGHGLDGWLLADHERYMKHRGAASKAP